MTARRLCLLLLAANAVLFLGEYFGRQSGQNASSGAVMAPVERLLLLDEAPRSPASGVAAAEEPRAGPGDRAEAAGAGEDAVPEAEVQPVLRCYRIGPFAERETASALVSRLGVPERIEAVASQELAGYWIMLPPAETPAAARRNLERLQAMGLQDLWLFEQGPWRGAISLGLYTQRERAERAAEQLRAQGLEVKVMPKHTTRTQYWVRLDRMSSGAWLEELPGGLEILPCPDQSESGDSAPASLTDPVTPAGTTRQ